MSYELQKVGGVDYAFVGFDESIGNFDQTVVVIGEVVTSRNPSEYIIHDLILIDSVPQGYVEMAAKPQRTKKSYQQTQRELPAFLR